MSHNGVVAIVFTFIGVVVAGISFPLIRRRIPMNYFYGIRFPAAFESDEAWYRINEHGGKCFLGYGVAHVVVAVAILLFLPEMQSQEWVRWVMLTPAILLIPTVICAARYPRS